MQRELGREGERERERERGGGGGERERERERGGVLKFSERLFFSLAICIYSLKICTACLIVS